MEKVKPYKNGETSNVITLGSKENYIVIETVAKFGNMMNYLNTKEEYHVYKNFQTVEVNPIEYDFLNSKEYKLVFNQVIKIIIENKEKELTKDNFNKVIDLEKNIFETALSKILESSGDVGFMIKKYQMP